MTEQQLRAINGSKIEVEWRGLRDWERVKGIVTALIYRKSNGQELLTVEVTGAATPNSKIICRPEDVYPLGSAEIWKSILGG